MIFNQVDEKQVSLDINDEIGFWGVTHQDFSNQLNSIGDADVQLNIASLGGDVNHAFSIFNSLKSHAGKVTANIYGDAASAATFIAMAADDINMVDNAMFLIHNVWTMAVGDADALRETADTMDKLNDNIVNVYRKKTGLTKAKIKSMMNKEEWWTAKEAKANGFIDKVVEPENIINRSEAVLMNCANDEMKKALVNKVNQLNTNKNQFKMTEENKNWFQEQFDNLKNSFVKEPVVQETVETPETISKEEVSEMLNSVKKEISNAKAENDKIVNAKDEEIAALKAELDKKNAKATEAKAETKSPESVDKEVKESISPLAKMFVNRLSANYNLKFK